MIPPPEPSVRAVPVLTDHRMLSVPVFAPAVVQAAVHVVMGVFRISAAVDVHLLTALFVAVEVFAVPFRIPDLTYLPEAVVAVSNGVSVRVRSAGNVAGAVVGVVFHAAFRRMDLQDPSPAVQNEIRPVQKSS